MFSKLSRGYGSWTGGYVDPYFGDKKHRRETTLPEIDQDSHCHGITVGARSGRNTAMSQKRSREPTQDSIPKTYTTRTGALQIFVASEKDEEEEEEDMDDLALHPQYRLKQRGGGKELIDLSLKLGTMERLALSVLQFGDKDYDHEHSSVTDEKNKAFLKFLHNIEESPRSKDPDVDTMVQPGGDLNTYLRELRSSSSMRREASGYLPRSKEAMELQALLRGLDNSGWPISYPQQDTASERSSHFTRPVSRISSTAPSPGPPSTPKPYQVLSSKKLAASVKSGCYLGRPSSRMDEDETLSETDILSPQHVTSASVTRKRWSPTDSTDDALLDAREKYYHAPTVSGSYVSEDWESEDLRSRRRFKERSFLTGSDALYQGRHALKVEGQRANDNTVTNKGGGHVEGAGGGMFQITEELAEHGNAIKKQIGEIDEADSASVNWEEKVADAKLKMQDSVKADISEKEPEPVNVAVDVEQKVTPRPRSRPSSHCSNSSDSSRASVKQNPSIITLQTCQKSKQLTVDKPHEGYKRRKSMSSAVWAFDPEKLKAACQGPRRRSSSHFDMQNSSSIQDTESHTSEKSFNVAHVTPAAHKYTFMPQAMDWSTDGGAPAKTQDAAKAIQININPFVVEEGSEYSSSHSGIDLNELNKSSKGEIDSESVMNEEEIIDDIQQCNKEIEQIEAMATLDKDVSSESEDDIDIVSDSTGADLELGIEDTETEVANAIDIGDGADTEVTESVSRAGLEDGADVVGDGEEDGGNADAVEVVMQENVDTAVVEVFDEDAQSEIRSRRSSKLKSVKSLRSVGGEQEDYNGAGTVDDGEGVLAGLNLETDQLSDIAPPPDWESAGFDISRYTSEPLLRVKEHTFAPRQDSKAVEASGESQPSADQPGPASEVGQPPSAVSSSPTISRPTSGSGRETTPKPETIPAPPNSECGQELTVTTEDNQNTNEQENGAIPKEDKSEALQTPNDEELQKQQAIADVKEKSIKKDDLSTLKVENPLNVISKSGIKDTKPVYIPRKSLSKKVTAKSKGKKTKGSDSKPEASVDASVEGAEKVAADSLDETAGDGSKAEDSADTQDAHNIVSELDALGLRKPAGGTKKKGKKEKPSQVFPIVPPGKRPKAPPEKEKIPDHLKEALDRAPSKSYESLEKNLEKRGFLKNGKVTELVDESLSGPTLDAIGEGLTEEELELAKELLQKKIEEAKGKMEGKDTKAAATPKKKAATKGAKKGGKKKKDDDEVEDDRTEEEKKRDAIREKHLMEKEKRDVEAKELQAKIAERRALLMAQEDMASAKSKEIREKMEQLEREADDLQRAEDEARDILAEVRKKQREEREARRKADLEKKRQDAADRREREKKELEDKKKKELEMMEKIADAEMRRRLKEEEERKLYEEERLAQERYEDELREAQRMEEEEEEKLKELERQAEEEAMQRLIEEREEAERQRRRLYEEEEALREAEQAKRELMMIEEQKLEAERQRLAEEENARKELERQRRLEFQRMEEEARAKMAEELEKKRQEALYRRDFNMDNRQNIDKLRHYQGITRAWTFSYFIRWPRDTYERPIGDPDPRKVVKIKNPTPKKQPPAETAPATDAAVTS